MISRFLFCFAYILISTCVTNHAHASEKNVLLKGMVAESIVELEVDGQPVTLKKRVGCVVHNYMKAGIDPASEIQSYGIAASHQLPTGEYVVAAMPTTCHRGNKVADEHGNLLPKDYLPWIAIFDKGPVPDKVVVYASARAYKASGARIKFNGVTMKHVTVEPGEDVEFSLKNQFNWFFQSPGRKGRGPVYASFNIAEAVMTDEFRNKLEASTSKKSGMVKVHNGYYQNNYFAWVHKYFREWEDKEKRIFKKDIIWPKYKGLKITESVRDTAFEDRSQAFFLREPIDWKSNNLIAELKPENTGMVAYYRIKPELFGQASSGLYKGNNIQFIFPSGVIYNHTRLSTPFHQIYDVDNQKYYRTGNGRILTPVLSGKLKKYNSEQITY